MKPYSYYSTFTTEYPSKSSYTVKYYYKRGKLICVKRPFCEIADVPPDAVEETVFDEDNFNLHQEAWFKEKLQLEQEFKEDLIREEGLEDMEKANKCFLLAWDYGCSQGLDEVHAYFSELVRLIK
jgi:hypothetical protein